MSKDETKTTYSELIIMAMQEGGFVVRVADGYRQILPSAIFAATTKREALDFINEKLSK